MSDMNGMRCQSSLRRSFLVAPASKPLGSTSSYEVSDDMGATKEASVFFSIILYRVVILRTAEHVDVSRAALHTCIPHILC